MEQNLKPMTVEQQAECDRSIKHFKDEWGIVHGEEAVVCSRSDDRSRVIVFLTPSELVARMYSDGFSHKWCIDLKDGTKCFYDQEATRILKHGKTKQTCGNYPMTSYAAGGHVDDTQKMMQEDSELGIRETHYEDGDPVFRSKGHRKEYCENRGMIDRNAGFSDPQ